MNPLNQSFLDFQGIIQLEKELAFLGSVCAAALMKKDLALPIGMKTHSIMEFFSCTFKFPYD